MKERAAIIGDLVDLRDVVDRLISDLSNASLFNNNKETNFAPLFEREFQEHRHWPPADQNQSRLSWEQRAALLARDTELELTGRVLEYVDGPCPSVSECFDCASEILIGQNWDCMNYDFAASSSVIHKDSSTINGEFDFIVALNSLSFVVDPSVILLQLKAKLKQFGKVFLRVRPWTSPCGGFQESYHNWAYSHLMQDLAHNDRVQWRVLQPLLEYDELFSDLGFIVQTREVASTPLIPHLQIDGEAFEILKERTWGEIAGDQARAILPIKHIDYTLVVA